MTTIRVHVMADGTTAYQIGLVLAMPAARQKRRIERKIAQFGDRRFGRQFLVDLKTLDVTLVLRKDET